MYGFFVWALIIRFTKSFVQPKPFLFFFSRSHSSTIRVQFQASLHFHVYSVHNYIPFHLIPQFYLRLVLINWLYTSYTCWVVELAVQSYRVPSIQDSNSLGDTNTISTPVSAMFQNHSNSIPMPLIKVQDLCKLMRFDHAGSKAH